MYEWLAEGQAPTGIPPAKIAGFRNRDGNLNTIRVDSKVVHETDTGQAKSDEARWMRFTLDTVGKTTWPHGPPGATDLSRRLRGAGDEAEAARCIRPGATCAAS